MFVQPPPEEEVHIGAEQDPRVRTRPALELFVCERERECARVQAGHQKSEMIDRCIGILNSLILTGPP